MSTSSAISSITIHKVPNYSTWNTQYSGGGISSNDLVIIPPTAIQEKINTNGLLKGSGGVISAATAGTDYVEPATVDSMKTLMNYAVVAAGEAGGTAPNFTLSSSITAYHDGDTIRFKLPAASGTNPTINVNNLGAVALKTSDGEAMPDTAAGIWVSATYCYNPVTPAESFFVLASSPQEQLPSANGNDF